MVARARASFSDRLTDRELGYLSGLLNNKGATNNVKEVLSDENFEILRDKCDNIRDLAMVELLASYV